MHRLSLSFVSSLMLVASMSAVAVAAEDGTRLPSDDPLDPVYVETAAIHRSGTDGTEAELVVSGSLPTPCHEAAWEVEHSGDSIRVWLWSLRATDEPCAAVLEPVELRFPLDTYDPQVPVLLDGEPVTRVVQADAAQPPTLVGAGWSFGMCLGYCVAALELDGATTTVTGADNGSVEPLFVNHGELTKDGVAQLAAATAALDASTLEPVYGCPDCADGGAAYVLLAQDGDTSRHDMEYGAPPEPLAELESVAMALITALETCTASELIDVTDDCSPYVGGSE